MRNFYNRFKYALRDRLNSLGICFVVLTALFAAPGADAQFVYPTLPDANQVAEGMWKNIFKNLCDDCLYNRDFARLYKYAYKEIYQNQKSPVPVAYYYMGACLELGMGGCETSTYKAKAHYEKGARLGDALCKKRLQSIRTNGYWGATAENRNAFARKHGRPCTPGAAPSAPSRGSGSPRNNGSATCKSCNGSGVCSYCGGTGEYWVDAGTYVAGDRYVKKTCTVCHGSRRCPSCHGKGHF